MQIPDLIDNERCQLAEILRGILAESQAPRMDVVTAFFNLRGLQVLEPEINHLVSLRLLLGKEQEQAFVVGERLLAELEEAISRGEVTTGEVGRWYDFLSREVVEIRRYTKAFLHGKAYIVHGVPALGALGIVGSSNFTGAGLTINRELNAVLKQSSAVKELQEWFDALWSESENYKSELLELLARFTCLYTPYEIYIKILYEALKDRLEQELSERGNQPSPIALTDFQHDGYLAAKEILENYNGVLIADSVGLGKTYLALRLLEDYAYRQRQTALIVCPAAIRDSVWAPLLQRFAIPHELVSMEELGRREFPVEEYARRFRIIVVDESHNFRNPHTNRWTNLYQLITKADGEDKKVILLTATPINNTVFDLYHQLRLITRDDRHFLAPIGLPDLWEYFRRAEENREALYEVLEALAIRRSRLFIRQHYPEAEIDGQKIRFPERELHTVHYSLKKTYGPDLYKAIAEAIENLLLAPYQVETYRREFVQARKGRIRQLSFFEAHKERQESLIHHLQEVLGWTQEQAHEFLMTIGRQTALAHIMRVLYLKRLESSIEALRISLRRLHRFLEMFLKALEEGKLLSTEEYRRWLQIEGLDEASIEGADWEEFMASLPKLPAEQYDLESIRTAVEADLRTLKGILAALESERPDDKLDTLKELLKSDPLQGKKVIVFSYFKDTARYLYQHLVNDPDLRAKSITIVDSEVKPSERAARIRRFAPRANGEPNMPPEEQFNLLISTDILSEGQNLQDADVIINYDLHWNPVRMVQRVGRLDRLGSPHTLIHIYNFFPEEELEDLLRLLDRLSQKLDAINRTVGLDVSILGETPNPKDFNILRRLEREDPTTLQDLEAESELTIGEFLKRDLLRYLKEAGEEKLKRIPYGVGTARKSKGGPRGFFAAFRNPKTGQHHWLFYDEEKDRIIERHLEAIRHIQSEPSEPAEPLPGEFDPRPHIIKLRRHLWNRIRGAYLKPDVLPSPQRKIVNWLYALPPSAERNRLLQYLSSRPLAGPDLKELRRLWRECSTLPPSKLLARFTEFVESHPPQLQQPSYSQASAIPENEEDLECIAWMVVM